MTLNMQFSTGDIIQDFEEPFVKYLDQVYKGHRCDLCLQSKPTIKCEKCETAFYCTLNCQRADWENSHSIECRIFSEPGVLSELNGEFAFIIIKVLTFLKKNGLNAKKRSTVYNATASRNQIFRKNCQNLAKILTATKLFTLTESSCMNLIHLYGIWQTNAFVLKDENERIGAAVYVGASVFDHSCRPNAIRVYDSSFRVQIRCIEDIPFGEAPKIAYFVGMLPIRNVRQEILHNNFYFTCDCNLCEMEKDKPVLDYDNLRCREIELKEKVILTADDFQHSEKFLGDLRKIFCKYDEQITNHMQNILEKLIFMLQNSHGQIMEASKLEEFAKEVDRHRAITYGTNEKHYMDIVETLRKNLS